MTIAITWRSNWPVTPPQTRARRRHQSPQDCRRPHRRSPSPRLQPLRRPDFKTAASQAGPRFTHGSAHTAALSPSGRHHDAIYQVLRQHEITLQNGFAIVYHEGRVIASFQLPQRAGATAQVKTWLPDQVAEEDPDGPAKEAPTDPTDAAILATAQRNDQPVFSLGTTDYALAATSLKQGNTVVVGLPMPFGMAATMTRLQKRAEAYSTLYSERRQIRDLYMLLLLMMTSLALFASCWLALHLSKQVTKPVEALADAMEAIASGDYAHRVQESATEELGELVAASITWPAISKTAVVPSSIPPCN